MNIWVPRVKIIEPKDIIGMKFGVSGYFMLEARNRYGQARRTVEWKQLITNTGLDGYGSVENNARNVTGEDLCVVGTGTTAPANTDTSLVAQTDSTSTINTSTQSYNSGGTYHETATTWDFGLGNVVANLTEVGCGTSGSTLAYRDLIRDSGGSPTTFPVTVDDQLRVTHVKRLYLPTVDAEGSFTITGAGVFDYTARIANSGSFGSGNSDPWSWRPTVSNTAGGTIGLGGKARVCCAHDTQTLGAITSVIGGSNTESATANLTAYSNGSYLRESSFTWGLADANYVDGIGGFSFSSFTTNANIGKAFQVSVSPQIEKFAGSIERILSLNARVSWARV